MVENVLLTGLLAKDFLLLSPINPHNFGLTLRLGSSSAVTTKRLLALRPLVGGGRAVLQSLFTGNRKGYIVVRLFTVHNQRLELHIAQTGTITETLRDLRSRCKRLFRLVGVLA